MNNCGSEYAKALFTLALEQNELEQYSVCLEVIQQIIAENEGYLEYLYSPAEPLSNKLSALDEAFSSAPELVLSFLKLLCENGRIRELPEYIKEFFELKKIYQNSITAQVWSAIPLSDVQKQKLTDRLSEVYKKNISPVYNVDKALLGGMKIEIDGQTLDGSVLKKLSSIKGAMNG